MFILGLNVYIRGIVDTVMPRCRAERAFSWPGPFEDAANRLARVTRITRAAFND